MFDIGFTEVLFTGLVATVAFGKKDMPIVFRLLGRGLGKISGLVQGLQLRMSDVSESSTLGQLQREINASIADLNTIKAELAMAGRIRPGITSSAHPGSSLLKGELQPQGMMLGQTPPLGQQQWGAGVGQVSNDPISGAGNNILPTLEGTSRPSLRDGSGSGVGLRSGSRGAAGLGGGVGGLGQAPRVGGGSNLHPGGERLQHLAMAELKFVEQGMYAPKTDMASGGADIVNETITDSLLFEQYRKAFHGNGESLSAMAPPPPSQDMEQRGMGEDSEAGEQALQDKGQRGMGEGSEAGEQALQDKGQEEK